MLPEKILKINPLKKVELGPETWDRGKLLVFLRTFGIQHVDIAKWIRVERSTVTRLVCGNIPFDPYHERLTAYKNAVIKSKIAEVEVFAEEMINHYKSFE